LIESALGIQGTPQKNKWEEGTGGAAKRALLAGDEKDRIPTFLNGEGG